ERARGRAVHRLLLGHLDGRRPRGGERGPLDRLPARPGRPDPALHDGDRVHGPAARARPELPDARAQAGAARAAFPEAARVIVAAGIWTQLFWTTALAGGLAAGVPLMFTALGEPLNGEFPLFSQPVIVYLGLAFAVFLAWMFRATNIGLNLRAAGEKPEALDAAGVSVVATRSYAALATGALAGLGGVHLAIVA